MIVVHPNNSTALSPCVKASNVSVLHAADTPKCHMNL